MGKQKLGQENKPDYFTVGCVAKRRACDWWLLVVYESQVEARTPKNHWHDDKLGQWKGRSAGWGGGGGGAQWEGGG